MAIISDKIFGKIDQDTFNKNIENSKYPKLYLFINLIIVISYTAILLYIMRNLLVFLPSPLHGICNMDHYRVKEIFALPPIIFILFFQYQYNLFSFSKVYVQKIFNTKNSPSTFDLQEPREIS